MIMWTGKVDPILGSQMICPVCGEKFYIHNLSLWTYKIRHGGNTYYYHIESCRRKAEKEFEEERAQLKEQQRIAANNNRKDSLSSKRSKVLRRKAAELYKSGWSIPNIAKEIGRSRQTVTDYLEMEGLYTVRRYKKVQH